MGTEALEDERGVSLDLLGLAASDKGLIDGAHQLRCTVHDLAVPECFEFGVAHWNPVDVDPKSNVSAAVGDARGVDDRLRCAADFGSCWESGAGGFSFRSPDTLCCLEGAALAEHPDFELWDKGCYDLGWRYDSSIVHDRADGGIFAGA